MTYAELVQKIRDYTEVDSNVLTSTIIDGFIENAEWRIQRDTDADYQRQYQTANLVAGQKFINLPQTYIIVRSVQIFTSTDTSLSGDRAYLEVRDTSFISEFNNTNATGFPKYYANWYENVLAFAPIPDNTYSIQVNYILKPPQLSASNTNTYLSQYFPNGLLYACLVEAFSFLKGPNDLLQLYEGRYKQAMEGFSIEQMGRRRRDEYQAGVPRVGKQ
jgi:hypothetical protein